MTAAPAARRRLAGKRLTPPAGGHRIPMSARDVFTTDLALMHAPSACDFRTSVIMHEPIANAVPSTNEFEMYPVGLTSIAPYLSANHYNVKIINLAYLMLASRDFDVEAYVAPRISSRSRRNPRRSPCACCTARRDKLGRQMPAQDETDGPLIVAGVDGSPSSRAALRWAVRQAALTGAIVEAVMAWQHQFVPGGYGGAAVAMISDVNYQELSEKALAQVISEVVDADDHARIRPRVAEGHASEVLLLAAADADLLVVGSRGHGSFAGALLGSVSQNCAHHAQCPVLIVRSAS